MDIVELVRDVELRDIACLQLVAERRSDPATGLAEPVEDGPEPDLDFDVHPVRWDSLIEVWFRASVQTANATLVAAYAVQYEREGREPIPDAVQHEFVERVAVMAALPYIREAIQGLGSRLRVPAPLLPILRQGEFRLASRDVDDDVEAEASE